MRDILTDSEALANGAAMLLGHPHMAGPGNALLLAAAALRMAGDDDLADDVEQRALDLPQTPDSSTLRNEAIWKRQENNVSVRHHI